MKKIFLILSIFLLLTQSCGVYKTYVNLSRLKFRLGNTNNILVAGIQVQGKNKLSDFGAMDILSLTSAFSRGVIPITFTLNVEAKNPNDGTGGYAKTNATIQSLPYRLVIDNKEVISGNIGNPVSGSSPAVAI